MKSSRNTARRLFGLTLTLVGLLSWNTLPIHASGQAVQEATRASVTEPTGQTVSRAVANGRIAYVSGEGNAFTDIYSMNPDGSNVQRLTNNPAHNYFDPAWSPDGSKIAFSSMRFWPSVSQLMQRIALENHGLLALGISGSKPIRKPRVPPSAPRSRTKADASSLFVEPEFSTRTFD